MVACISLPLGAASDDTILSAEIDPHFVYGAMQKVADWQLAQYDPEKNAFYEDASADGHTRGWVYAALYVGLSKWADLAESDHYTQTLLALAERNRWSFAPRIYNADDYAIGQLYIDLYERDPDPAYIAPLLAVADIIMASPSTVDLEFNKAEDIYEFYEDRRYSIVPCKNRWCWADALFMGPPVWTHLSRITGDSRYLDFADREFWATTDYLLDTEEHLFFRDSRYFDQREDNGAKIFWGRGNGWVLAGITRILQHLPADHVNRPRYEEVFRNMSSALVRAQTDEGYWLTSILSPGTFSNPESSGTGFIVYGLAWGVNNGLLDSKTFAGPIRKGWQSLIRAVHPDGKLGWVQQVASKPGSATFQDTQLYGVGAFLLAGSQVLALAESGELD
jgi:rhamnogalacturonyl hydrolase YesR